MTTRLTGAGWAALAFTLAAFAVGTLAANNLLLLVVALLIATGCADQVLGSANLRQVEVARRLPAELFAGRPAWGGLVLRNRRAGLAARQIWVREHGGEGAFIEQVEPGAAAEARVRWQLDERGVQHLMGVHFGSTWPLGLVRREARVALPAEVIVYPRPRGGSASTGRDEDGLDHGPGRIEDPWGDFVGLRPYRAGDRSPHWPTSARAGEPMVRQLAGGAGECVRIRVPDGMGRAWEDSLSLACGQVLVAFERGRAVALELPYRTFEPRTGGDWRRSLLDVLARAPRRAA